MQVPNDRFSSLANINIPFSNMPTLSVADSDAKSEAALKESKKAGKVECTTCAERKYQDGSDEMVSFKSPSHISPENSATKVRSHEQEHVSNAYKKAEQKDGKVINASVALHTSICPECGKSYVSGGTTSTMIKFSEQTPFDKNTKKFFEDATKGNNVDAIA